MATLPGDPQEDRGIKDINEEDVPKPLGKRLITTTFLDANQLHDIVIAKSVVAVLHFVNTTPTDWFLKRQTTVETATCGSEFATAKTATEPIMDLRYRTYEIWQLCLVMESRMSMRMWSV